MSGTTVSDHDLTLAIPGEVESVRARLVDAVQKLGYKILGEQPIYAKRGPQGAARWDCSLNVLEYAISLTVSLKQINNVSVLATFSYEVRHCVLMTKGDRQTLAREAEAIVALATERNAISACRACGTQITDESHFCRRCGAPLVVDVPELEILRLTRNARGSLYKILLGLPILLGAILTVLSVFIVKGGINGPLFFIGLSFMAYALFLLTQGAWQLHRTLNPKQVTKTVSANAYPALSTSVTTALPPMPVNASITEGTTELLLTRDRREKEPVPRKKDHDTAEFDTDRLM